MEQGSYRAAGGRKERHDFGVCGESLHAGGRLLHGGDVLVHHRRPARRHAFPGLLHHCRTVADCLPTGTTLLRLKQSDGAQRGSWERVRSVGRLLCPNSTGGKGTLVTCLRSAILARMAGSGAPLSASSESAYCERYASIPSSESLLSSAILRGSVWLSPLPQPTEPSRSLEQPVAPTETTFELKFTSESESTLDF